MKRVLLRKCIDKTEGLSRGCVLTVLYKIDVNFFATVSETNKNRLRNNRKRILAIRHHQMYGKTRKKQ